jgi:hypothetical protein
MIPIDTEVNINGLTRTFVEHASKRIEAKHRCRIENEILDELLADHICCSLRGAVARIFFAPSYFNNMAAMAAARF